ncbi:Hypothetical predicted protein, partial [Pelobates cultripes]
MKNRKAAGPDDIPAEALKSSVEMLYPLFKKIWEEEEITTDWKEGYLIKLPKEAIDWIMKTSTSERRNGIQWTLWSQLDDLYFADDLTRLFHSQQQMQEKISVLAATSAQVGFIIHKEKTKILKILKTNFSNINPITLNGSPLDQVQFFTYLGSIIDQQDGTDKNQC